MYSCGWCVARIRIDMVVNSVALCDSLEKRCKSHVTQISSMEKVQVPMKDAIPVLKIETTEAARKGCAYRAWTSLVFLLSALMSTALLALLALVLFTVALFAFVLFTKLNARTARAVIPPIHEFAALAPPIQRLKRVEHVAVGPEFEVSLFSPWLRVHSVRANPAVVLLLDAVPVENAPPASTALAVYDSRNWTVEPPAEVWTVTVKLAETTPVVFRVAERTRDDANKTDSNNTVTTEEWSLSTWNRIWLGVSAAVVMAVHMLNPQVDAAGIYACYNDECG